MNVGRSSPRTVDAGGSSVELDRAGGERERAREARERGERQQVTIPVRERERGRHTLGSMSSSVIRKAGSVLAERRAALPVACDGYWKILPEDRYQATENTISQS